VLFFMIKPYAEAYWASFRDFTNQHYYDIKLKEWSNKPTDFLIGKLGHPAPSWDGVAGNILANRKDLSREDKLINIIKSDLSTKKREAVLGVLFCWDEKKSIDLSMEILESGKGHPLYEVAMRHLAHRKYEPAYSYVVALAKEPDPFGNGSIGMLEDFGKIESIPLLEAMSSHVRIQDKMVARLDKSSITHAIQSIKEKNGISK